MARITTSGLISNIAGSIGGSTFQQSNAGLIMKKKNLPINPSTLPQYVQRSRMASLQSLWVNFTNAERIAWQSFASFAKVTQKNNLTRFLNGQQIFLQINSFRLLKGLEVITEPVFAPFSVVLPSFSFSVTSISARFECDRTIDEDAETYLLYVTAPCSQGIQSYKRAYKNIPLSALQEDDYYFFTSAYETVYGVKADADIHTFYKWICLDVVTGLTSGWQYGIDFLPVTV